MEIRNKDTYVCRRLRLLEYLIGLNYKPIKTIPDKDNPLNYKNWIFDAREYGFKEDLAEYFAQFKK